MKQTETSQPVLSRAAGFAFLAVTAVGWGVAWPATKQLLTELPPLTVRGLAGLTGALALAILALARGEGLRVPRHQWTRLFVVSVMSVGVWTGFVGFALLWLNAGEAAVIAAIGPVWISLLAWLMLGERFSLMRIVAVIGAMVALAVLFGVDASDASLAKLPGMLLVVVATMLVGLGTVLTKRFALQMSALALSVWQLGCGCFVVVVAGLLTERPQFAALSNTGWLLFCYMAFVQFCVCYACWFAALRRLPASTASTGTLLTPAVGVVAAAIALHEPLGAREIVALLLVLGSVVLAARG